MRSLRVAIRKAARWLAGTLVCAAVIATAQTTPRSPAPNATAGPYRIAGVLVNAATGEPILRAIVEALKVDDSQRGSLLRDRQ